MAFRDLIDIIGPLTLTIRGKNYTLPAVSLADGIAMHKAATNETAIPLKDMIRAILGDVKAEMEADGVPVSIIDRALWTGVTDFQSGREAAELVWEHGVPKGIVDKLVEPLMEALTTLPAAESTTPPLASGSGTTAPRSKAPQPRGPRSSKKRTGR